MLSRNEIRGLIKSKGSEQGKLFESARQVRNERFGKKVYVRAVVEPSSYCRQDCHYCPMRLSNRELSRYRLSPDEILSSAEQVSSFDIDTVLLESGEDRQIVESIAAATSRLKSMSYKVILCLGDLKRDDYRKLRESGADAYILKFETSDEKLFEKMRPGTTLRNRLKNLEYLRGLGFLISTGNIVGFPEQTVESLIDDITLANKINPDMVSASPFIPAAGTPLEHSPFGNIDPTLNTLAIYRITLPHTPIPAVSALEYYKERGQLAGLNAGCNVVTVNFTPEFANFPIYAAERLRIKLDHVNNAIAEAGLELSIWRKYK